MSGYPSLREEISSDNEKSKRSNPKAHGAQRNNPSVLASKVGNPRTSLRPNGLLRSVPILIGTPLAMTFIKRLSQNAYPSSLLSSRLSCVKPRSSYKQFVIKNEL